AKNNAKIEHLFDKSAIDTENYAKVGDCSLYIRTNLRKLK
ncbi:MAG: hypothetical protein RL362_641, partial [Bacteroidota bacterium]